MSIADKLQTISENEQRVYDAGKSYGETVGKKAQYDEFWDIVTKNGTRTAYRFAFANWDCEYIRPNRKIVATTEGVQNMFATNPSLIKIEKEYFDLSQHPAGANSSTMCMNCNSLEVFEDIGLHGQTSYVGTFQNDRSLHTIEVLRCMAETTYHNTVFFNCDALKNLTIEGVIGQNGFDVHWSTKLSKASITSVINALSTTTSGLTATLSKTAVNKAFETTSGANDGATSTEWLALRATKSNWTISLV